MTVDNYNNVFDHFRRNNISYGNRTINNTNGYIQTKPTLINDECSFTGGMSENLVYSKEYSIAGGVCAGSINGKDAKIKVVGNKNAIHYEGLIGDKKLLLTCQKGENNKENFSGSYGGKEFNINVDYNKPSKLSSFYHCKLRHKTFIPDYFNINGTIGNKPISLNLPNAEIPKDDYEKDLVTVLLFKHGLEARTFNGKIIQLGTTRMYKSDIMDAEEERNKKFDENVKPLIMQAGSTIVGTVISVIIATALAKAGIKNAMH